MNEDPPKPLQCDYFDAGRCRSCALIQTPYAEQLAAKEQRCRELLPETSPDVWLPVFTAGDRGFRNRVKLVVGGVAGAVTLGILGPDQRGVDLRDCQIQAPGIAAVIPVLAEFLESTGLAPYDVPARRGELKFAHITESPDAALMIRFVVRSQHGLDVLRSRLGALRAALPSAEVITVNLLPGHRAVLEGEREELLWGESLPMRINGSAEREPITLHLRPQSFFQTNTVVAEALYAQVAEWTACIQPERLWDLYCGVGAFALHCAAASATLAEVIGVETSAAAVESARRSAREAGIRAQFVVGDAGEFAQGAESTADAVVVNPPRRGIGIELAQWIERSGVPHVVYSSCNPESLARDLETLMSYEIREARVFDMFPHTNHLEVAVLLSKRAHVRR